MTLGERIQALRKRDGLSQEQLGEKLGVSRQAISKWEGDVTIPEVDKLVALSKLFYVPVGAMLGVEAVPAAEFGEKELSAVESILSRYVEEAQAHPQPQRKRWPWILSGAAVCAALLCCVLLLDGSVRRLDSRIDSVQAQVSSIDSDVSAQISGMTGRVEHMLKEQNDLLVDSSWDVKDADLATGTITLSLTATPKRYVEGMTLEFQVTSPDFAPMVLSGERVAASSFTAEFTCPLTNEINLSAVLSESAEKWTAPMNGAYGLAKEYSLEVTVWGDRTTVAVEISVGNAANATPVAAEVRAYRGGTLEHTYPIELRDLSEEARPSPNAPPTVSGPVTYFIYPETMVGLTFTAYVKDSAGREYDVPIE